MTISSKTTFATFLNSLVAKIAQARLGRYGLILLFLATFDVDYMPKGDQTIIDVEFYAFGGILFVLAALVLFLAIAYHLFKVIPQFKNVITYSISNRGLVIRGPNFESILDRENIQDISETRDAFIISQSPLNWFVLPKAQLTTEQVQSMRLILADEPAIALQLVQY